MSAPDLTTLDRLPIIASWGVGEDSTAMLIELTRKGIIVDAILFADTGGEQERTYDFFPFFADWLEREGQPRPVVVRYVPQKFKHWPPYYSLEDNCLTNGTLPSLAFGFKSCSQKWKIAPQDKAVAQMEVAQKCWAAGGRVQKLIGYDASPADIRRRNHVGAIDDPRYNYRYPLQQWGWDRQHVVAYNKAALGRNPGKSSCFFCPAMKPDEVRALSADHLKRIVVMEVRAEPRLTTTEGLWRKSTKAKPGSMTTFIRNEGLLPADEIAAIRERTFTDIVSYQQAYADALARGEAEAFVAQYGEGYRHQEKEVA